MKKTSMNMLYEWIVKENINQSDLCQGLCSTSAFLIAYVFGKKNHDVLLCRYKMNRSIN